MGQSLMHGIYTPGDLQVMRDVFITVSSEPWFSQGAANRTGLAHYIMRMYRHGLVERDKLEDLCRIAARAKFALHTGLEGYRFLLVEDDYYTASEAMERLRTLGAQVLAVPTMSAALEIAEYEFDLDGALLDVNLSREIFYPVAAFLSMRQIPFAFVTGYDEMSRPPFYRDAKVFTKPTDWAAAARHVTGRVPVAAAAYGT